MLRLPLEERATFDLTSLDSILHIGAPCSLHTKRGWIEWIGAERITEVYAGSESAGLTMIRGDEWLKRPGSVGRPIGGSQMRVVSTSTGAELSAGEVGLVQMRREGPDTYRYVGSESPVVDGWHTLGDLGKADSAGFLWILDRADDLIVRGGEKIAPITIEHALEAHPSVRSAVAFGEPDDDLGQRAVAIADIANAKVGATELMAWARGILGSSSPNEIRISAEPLRDDAGKVRRRTFTTGGRAI